MIPSPHKSILNHKEDGKNIYLFESHPTATRLGEGYGGDKVGEAGWDACIPNLTPNGTDITSRIADDNIYLKIVFRNNSNVDSLKIATPVGKVNRDAAVIDPFTVNPE